MSAGAAGAAVVAEKLTRRFGPVVAVDSLDLAINEGEVFGLLGPNGAGKTTTIRMLTALLPPTSGTARVCGYDVRAQAEGVRACLGVVSEGVDIYGDLTVGENLFFFGRLYGLRGRRLKRRIGELAGFLHLESKLRALVWELSTGFKKRALIALALIHDPQVLFFDEVTTGLDPQSAIAIRRFAKDLAAAGKTVVWTTHVMDEPEKLCDRIAIISGGRTIAIGTAHELLVKAGSESLEQAFVRLTEGKDEVLR